MDKYIKMLVYKLKDKIQFNTLYQIKYKGKWESYYTKREVINRLIQIDKENS